MREVRAEIDNGGDANELDPSVMLAIGRLDSCNGIAEYFRRLARHFRARSAPVDVLVGRLVHYPQTNERLADLRAAAGRLRICAEAYDLDQALDRPLGFYREVFASCREPRGRKAIINTHSLDAFSVCAMASRFSPRIRVVHTFHLSPDYRRISFLSSAAGRLLIRGNPRVRFIAISSEIEQILLRDAAVPRERVQKICHGVDTEVFRPPSREERARARKQFDIDEKCCCLAMVGRLDAIKGFEELFPALAMLPAARERFRLICVGTGDVGWVQQRAAEYGLTGILRMVGEGDPIPALWASDQFVLPSRHEGFAIVCVEAMACGLPLVRTNTAGARDQIEENQNGYSVPVGDIALLASKIAALADDDELRCRMGRAARACALEKFHAEKLLEETRAIFNYAVNC